MRRGLVAPTPFSDLPFLRHDALEILEEIFWRIWQLLRHLRDNIFWAPGLVIFFVIFRRTGHSYQLDVVIESDFLRSILL